VGGVGGRLVLRRGRQMLESQRSSQRRHNQPGRVLRVPVG
jgi:hypothetical protein